MGLLLTRASAALHYAWARYPARTTSVVASVVVFAAAKVGLVLPEATTLQAVAETLPLLVGGQVIHNRVTPSPKA